MPLALALPLAGCPTERSAQPRRSEPSARTGRKIIRSLIAEATRAELWERGLLIDLGTPDQHKYTGGGWRTGWGAVGGDGSTTYAEVIRAGRLSYRDWHGGARAVRLRLRALHDGQRLSLELDGESVGDSRPVSRSWQVLELPVKGAALPPGPRTLALRFTEGEDREPAAQVDWVWVRSGDGPPPEAAKVATLALGEPRRALAATAGRTLSYYLQVPERAALVLDHAGAPGLELAVQATADGARTQTLLEVKGQPRWREASVSLAALAGRAVRLDLVARGVAGARGGWGEPDIVAPGPRPTRTAVTGRRQPRNLIYVMIDTARRDVFRSFNQHTTVYAPAMERFAARATRFDRAYSNTNWTLPSVATIWSGLYPATHGAMGKTAYLSEEVPLLPEHLQRHGFTTAAFIANGYTSDKFGFKRGWDRYRNYIREDKPSEAEQVYADAAAWLREQAGSPRRLFLYLQPIDPHVPYAVPASDLERYHPEPYTGRLGPSVSGHETADFNQGKLELGQDDHRFIKALYRGEISYHDRHFGRFLERLEELGLMEDSLVVVSNDHGEELMDHGKYGHGHTLHEELIRCPLLMRFPPIFPPAREVRSIVELVDVLPTVLEVLGVEPLKGVDGLSVIGTLSGQQPLVPGSAVSEHLDQARSIRVGRLKLIRFRSGREELYDLREDPTEHRDLARSHPVSRRAAAVYLGEALGAPNKARRLTSMARSRCFRGKTAVMDPTLRRQLRALGYIN